MRTYHCSRAQNKQSTWVSRFLKATGLKDHSTLKSGSINALRHWYIDYKIRPLNKMTYSEQERIKLAALLKHSVMTTPKYLSFVDSGKVPLDTKQKE